MWNKFKNSTRLSVIYLTLMTFVIANIGMTVYTHSCTISGIEKSMFVKMEDPCDVKHEHPEQAPIAPTCCHIPESNELTMDDGSCCTTDTNVVVLQTDSIFDNAAVKLLLNDISFVPFEPVFYALYVVPVIESKEVTTIHKNKPPSYQNRDLQSLHQVYII